MAAPDDITADIATNAQGPAAASNKTESATAHDPTKLIEVDKYLRARAAETAAEAAENPFGQLRFVQVYPPGACTQI